jgi:signal transduction histidine kinase
VKLSRRRTLFLGVALSVVALSHTALAADATRADAIAIVKKAVAAYQSDGKAKLIADVNTKNGPYHRGDLYVILYDRKGTNVAHPINPKLIGRATVDVPDVDGKLFRKEMVDHAAAGKSGFWVDYRYTHPVTGKVEPKTAYYEVVGDVIVAAGIYTP